MQRLVDERRIGYAEIEKVNGEFVVKDASVNIRNEKNADKAEKKAIKEVGRVQILSNEQYRVLYMLDDEIFFKHAKPVKAFKVTDDGEVEVNLAEAGYEG